MVETDVFEAFGQLNGLGWPAVTVIGLWLVYKGFLRHLESRKSPAIEALAEKVINGRFNEILRQVENLKIRVRRIEEKR